MNSGLPKALQPLCGRPMLGFLTDAVKALEPAKTVVVVGWRSDLVKIFVGRSVEVVLQKELLGSGHAVMQAEHALKGFSGPVLVLYCDTPLVSTHTLEQLLERYHATGADCVLLSVKFADPTGYGRVIRGQGGTVAAIVEESDATSAEKAIREVNVGCYVFSGEKLFKVLKQVPRNEKKKEYYLTDAVGILAREGGVEAVVAQDASEMQGANTPRELAALEGRMQEKILEALMTQGVRIRDPRTTTIDAGVKIGAGTTVLPHTVIEDGSVIGKDCTIGPFARIRGKSRIGDRVIVGNFVEIVRSVIGNGTSVKHLSYVGDSVIGKDVNIGAGTITANYDGRAKHRTTVKDGASIGSGTVLVAPVTVGKRAVTGAGSVVTKRQNVRDGQTVAGVPARPLINKNKKGVTGGR
jgi:bifunctional UDP-N-acetylglucosamine pyrophosphorylase/glucosamine-1-phosphate N-acetyltransferase